MGSVFYSCDEPLEYDVLKNAPPRLPHFVTADTLRRLGYTEDLIETLWPDVTHIAYFEADKRNSQDREDFYKVPGNSFKGHIFSYLDASWIIKGVANPSGSGPLLQVHRDITPESSWHASPEEIRKKLSDSFGGNGTDIAVTIHQVLDLAVQPNFASQAFPEPCEPTLASSQVYYVELSLNRVGTQQALIAHENVAYDNTVPIEQIYQILKPEA